MAKKRPLPQAMIDRQWKPGQSGNPGGRPKNTSLTSRLRKALEADDGQLAEMLIKVAIREAGRGKFPFFKEIVDRMDGELGQAEEPDREPASIHIHMADGTETTNPMGEPAESESKDEQAPKGEPTEPENGSG